MSSDRAIVFLIIGLAHGLPLDAPSESLAKYFDSRIIGGTDTPQNLARHMAAIIVGEPSKVLICGGSIVSARAVLTAAHCFDSSIDRNGDLLSSLEVVVGTTELRSGGVFSKIDTFHVHPDWDEELIKNDVGVVTLVETLSFGERIAAIPLSWDWVDGGEESYVTGYGLSAWIVLPRKLQILYVETIVHEECKTAVTQTSEKGQMPQINPDVELCTFHSAGRGVCHGDSGSALVQLKTGHQIGVVSWGFPCAIGAPDIFTRISAFKDYLVLIIKAHM